MADLVLIGGGHSHAIVLKLWSMKPLPGVQITLISDVVQTPYSGMLPGYIAGAYSFDECHIDLRPLAMAAGARLIVDRAIGLDLANQRVICANRPAVAFDWLSINIGSIPNTLTVPGANEYAIPAKPISQFLHHWQALLDQLAGSESSSEVPVVKGDLGGSSPLTIGIVGGGIGGIELALAMQAKLQQVHQYAGRSPDSITIHLFQRGDRLAPDRHPRIGRQLHRVLQQRGIHSHLGETVSAVSTVGAKHLHGDLPSSTTDLSANALPLQVTCASGLTVACDRLFWVTQAAAAPWLRASGLATDTQGFIHVNNCLQSISHPNVFAAGDIATMVNHPRPKAGVFAVRQGKPLFHNLCRALLNKSLQPFIPQRDFLALIGTGNRQAIALRNNLISPPFPLLWHWKGWIDRRFIAKFTDLKPMVMESSEFRVRSAEFRVWSTRLELHTSNLELRTPMYCSGCGSKVGSDILGQSLTRLRQEYPDWGDSPDVLIGLDAPDDAAVVQVPTGKVLVQTVDHFRALVNDPFLLGQITANHCLSDLFAMGAEAHSALAIVTLPYAPPQHQEETLFQLLAGTVKALQQANATLIGGHTTEGEELIVGLACNGFADPNHLWRKSGLRPEQTLILTKALGTGTLFAADMRLKAKGCWIDSAIQSMLLSNQAAAIILRHHGATTCTDVTGFGLLGHLLELVRASQVSVHLNLDAISILDGALVTSQQGILSSLHPQNLQATHAIPTPDHIRYHPHFPLLFDPQTSGGLLASVPATHVNACLTALQAAGYADAAAIGHTRDNSSPLVTYSPSHRFC